MIPRSCRTRNVREAAKGQLGGRTQEIQRLVGRTLRSVFDMKVIGERTIWMDCDVIQADGGTRTAAITGAFVALAEASDWLVKEKLVKKNPITDLVAAISVGIVGGEDMLDLQYTEDCVAAVDMNVAMTGSGKFVEVQGTAEGLPFSREKFNKLLDLGQKGITELFAIQRSVLEGIL
jgi:ribonuclease PH